MDIFSAGILVEGIPLPEKDELVEGETLDGGSQRIAGILQRLRVALAQSFRPTFP